MLYVMITILIFSVPWILFLLNAIEYKRGKRENLPWKLSAILLISFTIISILIQIHLLKTYHFPLFQTNMESIIGISIIAFIAGFILIINLIISKSVGKNLPKSVHDPKTVNVVALCFALSFFTVLFIAAPTGKKIAFATSINLAMETTSKTDSKEFSIVLVSSERECLRNTSSCRSSAYSNKFFIKNNLNKTQEVQVKVRALNSSHEEMKVIDSDIMTLKPNELRLLETEETSEDTSVWNQNSFQTDHRISQYEHIYQYRNPE